MIKNIKFRWIVSAAVLCIFLSVLLLVSRAKLDISYCVDFVKSDNFYAGICENDDNYYIFKTDANKKIQTSLRFKTNYYIKGVIKRPDCVFTDDEGNVYVLSSVYGDDGQIVSKEIGRCNFSIGAVSNECVIDKPKGMQFADYNIPYEENGKFYITAVYEHEIISLMCDSENGVKEISRTAVPSGVSAEKSIAAGESIYYIDSMTGLYRNEAKIYPKGNQEVLLSGFSYADEKIVVTDINSGSIVIVSADGDIISNEPISKDVNFDYLQNAKPYADNSFTCSVEDGTALRAGEYLNGSMHSYSELCYTVFSPYFIRMFVLAELCGALFFVLIWFLLSYHKSINTEREYVSITTKISVIFVLLTAVIVFFVGVSVYKSIDNIYSYWSNDKMLSAGVMYYMLPYNAEEKGKCAVYAENGLPTLSDAAKNYINSYMQKSSKGEGNILGYDYMLVVSYNDRLYSVYSGANESAVPLEYVVSMSTADNIKRAIDEFTIESSFENLMTTGKYNYYVRVGTYGASIEGAECFATAACCISNGYADKINELRDMPKIIAVIIVLSVVIVVFLNVLMRLFLRKLKRLKTALEEYQATGNYSKISVTGGDEIDITSDAIAGMLNGLKIYTNDINLTNKNYGELLRVGILKIMGKDSITRISPGEKVSDDMRIVRILFFGIERGEAEEIMGDIFSLAEKHEGITVDFNIDRVTLAFYRDSDLFPKFISELMNAKYAGSKFGILISAGSCEAGYIYDGRNSKLVLISSAQASFNKMEKIIGGRHFLCVGDYEELLSLKLKGDKIYSGTDGIFCEVAAE